MRVLKPTTRGVLDVVCPIVFILFMVTAAPSLRARSIDSDDGGSDMAGDERRQRMEMLRSMSPPSSNQTNSRSYQPAVDTDSYAYKAGVKAQPDNSPNSLPHINKPQPYMRTPTETRPPRIAQSTNKTASNQRLKSSNQPSKTHQSAKIKNTTKSAKTPTSSPQTRKVDEQVKRKPKCGFCLVNGYLYCGDQGVSLEKLIQQNQQQNATKRQKPRIKPVKKTLKARVPKKQGAK